MSDVNPLPGMPLSQDTEAEKSTLTQDLQTMMILQTYLTHQTHLTPSGHLLL
jgi:hypothetical protein